MNRRALILLGLGAATSLGAAWLFAPGESETRAGFAPGTLAFPDLAPRLAEAARIEIARGDAALHILRAGDDWALAELHAYRARPEQVRELLAGLTELRLMEERTGDAARLDRLGLDDASAVRLRVLDAGGRAVAELHLGRRRVRTQGGVPETIYVRRPGEARSWLAEGRLVAEPEAQLWVDRDVANIPPARIRRVEVSRLGEPPLALARDPAGQELLVVETPADAPAADRTALDEVARAFDLLTFTGVLPAAAAPGNPLGEARFLLDSGAAVLARARKDDERVWLLLSAEGDAEAERWNARWRGWAYQIGAWKEQAVVPRLADLLPR
jgi:hypothetical protein